MKRINFLELLESNKTSGYVFYDCGILHNTIKDFLLESDESILLTKDNMYNKPEVCNSISTLQESAHDLSTFVIDLDEIWNWLGFSQKAIAKKLLEKHFILNIDYITLMSNSVFDKKGRGGHNKEIILLSINTFNLFCLKGDTIQSGKIHEYYVNLEKMVIKSLNDEYSVFKKNTQVADFIKELDDLIPILNTKKESITRHLIKNYKENIHYIIKHLDTKLVGSRGGHNKKTYMLTEYSFELLKNSYNFRNRYLLNVNQNIHCVNIGMCIENQTIGFIENSFQGVIVSKRQHIIGIYKVDLYFPEYKLGIECDEYNHIDRTNENEKCREDYIVSLGNTLIRFDPNADRFDLSMVLKEINKIFMSKQIINNKIIRLP